MRTVGAEVVGCIVVGRAEGSHEGEAVGFKLTDGALVDGACVGVNVGLLLGAMEGLTVGKTVG